MTQTTPRKPLWSHNILEKLVNFFLLALFQPPAPKCVSGELISQQFCMTLTGTSGQNLNKARVSVLLGKSDLGWKLLFSYWERPSGCLVKAIHSLLGKVKQLAVFSDEATHVAARFYCHRAQCRPSWRHCHRGSSTGGWGQGGQLGPRFGRHINCFWTTLPS